MEEQSYIAYFDLLGTRGFCEDPKIYYNNIEIFNSSIELLSTYLRGYGHIGFFSDCAYAESNDLSYLLQTMILYLE